VLLSVLILSACVAASAKPLVLPTSTSTLPVAATVTPFPTRRPITLTSTRTPRATRVRIQTATPLPAPTSTPDVPTLTPEASTPASIATPAPALPPQPDGVQRRADVPILMYHYISAAPPAQDRIRYGLSVPPETFDAQLKLLHDSGFTTISLHDLYEYLAQGQALPIKPIILTFDDGYVDNYTNAFPILQKYGMVGTFFVLTGPADEGNPAYLTWDMITQMSQAGMDIQLHSRDHLDMRNRSFDWLVFQIIGGRQSIEGHTGKPVIFIAYPSGKYDAVVERFLRSNGFWAAVTTVFGSTHLLSDALEWDRVRISGQMRLSDFARLLSLYSSGANSDNQQLGAAGPGTPMSTPSTTKTSSSALTHIPFTSPQATPIPLPSR